MRHEAIVLAITLMLAVASVNTLATNVRTAYAWTGTITINPDGSVSPVGVPVQVVGNKYTLTADITLPGSGLAIDYQMVSPIIIDGAGHSITGPAVMPHVGAGINIWGEETNQSLIVKNLHFVNLAVGIELDAMNFNSTITSNVFKNCTVAISLGTSRYGGGDNDIVTGNTIYWCGSAMHLEAMSNTLVTGNNITANGYAIFGVAERNATIRDNLITHNTEGGISLVSSSLAKILDNTIIENGRDGISITSGIYYNLWYAENFTITGNQIANNLGDGIKLNGTQRSNVTMNTIRDNDGNGITLDKWYNNYENPFWLFSTNNTVNDNTIQGNGGYGVWLPNSIIGGPYPKTDNKFYHDSFITNQAGQLRSAYASVKADTWDNGYPSGGNYWSDYNDTDIYNGPNQNLAGSDGIGDHPYVIGIGNADRYPLMSFSDEFASTLINTRWAWTNQPQNSYTSSGWLVVQPTLGTNFWSGVDSGQFLYQYMSGNFMVQTKVSATLSSNYQQAGLMIRRDTSNWAKIDFEYSNGPTVKTGINRNNVASTGKATTLPTSTTTVWLRVVKYGDYFTASYSLDGSTWSQHFSWSQPLLGTLKVGLCVTDANSGVAFQPSFDYFRYSNLVPYAFAKEIDGISYPVQAISNSAVSGFSINQSAKMIAFNITGVSGTSGFCNLTMPRVLLEEPYTVRVDGFLVSPVVTSNSTHTSLYFTYIHSTHRVEIVGATIVPEFPTMAANVLIMVVLAFLLLLARRRMTAVCQHIPGASDFNRNT